MTREELFYVVRGRVAVHTEFYDPNVLEVGQSMYIDSTMGHAHLLADGCGEAEVLSVMSRGDEELMRSLLEIHGGQRSRKQVTSRRKTASRLRNI